MKEHSSLVVLRKPLFSHVSRDGHWPLAWAFRVYDEAGDFIYGEEHIESRRAAQKDADDIIARLNDGRLAVAAGSGVVYAP